MKNIVKINNHQLRVKKFENQRVVTFKDIDRLHERPEGTAGRNFRDNRKHFFEGEDYFELQGTEAYNFATTFSVGTNPSKVRNLILITESGYLLLVKTLQDNLAWQVQRELVNNYFRVKEIVQPKTELQVLRMAIDQIEVAQKTAREAKQIAQDIRNTILHPDEDWRNWVNDQFGKIGFINGNYRKLRKQSYDILENRAHCRLNVRLSNLRDRLKETGATKTKISQTNYLDVIEEDPRLKEIYTSVVKKIVIKYSA
ncbi:hypothetical protein GM661_00345 [Iocasia frigidifontis]|uniref:KilA-N DNA-binding domain-containing protein n=1 Tax=Iocasia fonsfrigidae TaxID=2682810 RepID=A0A8A7K476_9FIRM|nr:ORF6N domain-containing protein [Iocasia fonsfrigidae]QTL96523.1 hypothetical protein GM661_00345 [Iocasia fonsfrigidae]